MPKMKTHRAGAKRYKVTANGKILRRQAGKKHLLTHKCAERRRRLSGMVAVSETNLDKVKLELPYIKYSR
ncbi:MAG: 50S ribosomal protein L35 [Candidatus Gastranaerophilales bacterium]|nr:50S ribosomal protein L35 [Candidatus Gastranaerophilales bacterium]